MRGMRGILYHGIYTRFLSKTNLFCTVTKPVSLVTIKVWTLSFHSCSRIPTTYAPTKGPRPNAPDARQQRTAGVSAALACSRRAAGSHVRRNGHARTSASGGAHASCPRECHNRPARSDKLQIFRAPELPADGNHGAPGHPPR